MIRLLASALLLTSGAVLAQAPAPVSPKSAPPPIVAPGGPAKATAGSAVAGGTRTADDCGPCGSVESIRQVSVRQEWTALGAGVAVGGTNAQSGPGGTGGVTTAFQIGRGGDNQGMVILGAAGGANYRKSPNSYEQSRWDVTVRLDGGRTQVVRMAFEPYVREGDRVRIAGNNVELVN
jgi:hypothetical protein